MRGADYVLGGCYCDVWVDFLRMSLFRIVDRIHMKDMVLYDERLFGGVLLSG